MTAAMHLLLDRAAIVGMDEIVEAVVVDGDIGRQARHDLELGGPDRSVGRQLHLPDAEAGRLDGEAHQLLVLPAAPARRPCAPGCR